MELGVLLIVKMLSLFQKTTEIMDIVFGTPAISAIPPLPLDRSIEEIISNSNTMGKSIKSK